MSDSRACATMDSPCARATDARQGLSLSRPVTDCAFVAESGRRGGERSLSAFGFESVDAFRAAALELDDAQLEFTCHAMHCFMQAYLENLQ
jgi:hypothetical protein